MTRNNMNENNTSAMCGAEVAQQPKHLTLIESVHQMNEVRDRLESLLEKIVGIGNDKKCVDPTHQPTLNEVLNAAPQMLDSTRCECHDYIGRIEDALF